MARLIYVPDLENYECFVVKEEGVIRAYEEIPRRNSTINYRDYYIESDYIYRDDSQNFSNYSTLPICLSSDVVSDNVYYRTDFDSILIIFIIFAFICIWCPLKIFMRLFRRFN